MSARDLLTESGSIFVQIGDENVHLVRSVLDEVFGAKTSLIALRSRSRGTGRKLLNRSSDFLLSVCTAINLCDKYQNLFTLGKCRDLWPLFASVELEDGIRRSLLPAERYRPVAPTNGFSTFPDRQSFLKRTWRQHTFHVRKHQGRSYMPNARRHWSTHKEGMEKFALLRRSDLCGRRFSELYSVSSTISQLRQ